MLQDKLHMPYLNQTEVRIMPSVISRLLHHSALLVALYFTFFGGSFFLRSFHETWKNNFKSSHLKYTELFFQVC